MVYGNLLQHSNYTFTGSVSHAYGADSDDFEIPLDNVALSKSLFTFTKTTNGFTFSLKDNQKIDIFERWNSATAKKYLGIETLLYSAHTLRLSAASKIGKVANQYKVFNFRKGAKVWVNTTNAVSRTPAQGCIPLPSDADLADVAKPVRDDLEEKIQHTEYDFEDPGHDPKYDLHLTWGKVFIRDFTSDYHVYNNLCDGGNPTYSFSGNATLTVFPGSPRLIDTERCGG